MNIELTDKDVTNLRSTIEARLIRMKRWLAEAREANRQKEVDIWTFQIAEKSVLLKKIRKAMTDRAQRIKELEAVFSEPCKRTALHPGGPMEFWTHTDDGWIDESIDDKPCPVCDATAVFKGTISLGPNQVPSLYCGCGFHCTAKHWNKLLRSRRQPKAKGLDDDE